MNKTILSLLCLSTCNATLAKLPSTLPNSVNNKVTTKALNAYVPYKFILPILQQKVKIPILLPSADRVAQYIFKKDLVPANIFRASTDNYTVLF